MENLNSSLSQYKEQLLLVNQSIDTTKDENERESLLSLQSDLMQLIQLTQESLNAVKARNIPENDKNSTKEQLENKNVLDEEYSLFMKEMADSGAYDIDNNQQQSEANDSDIEDELSSLLGMKCAVYHTHKWGGQPCLYNAMVSAIVPHQSNDQFKDLQVRVMFTHPTHAEMLPCPFYLEGECRFDDEQCRYSHGTITQLSNLKEAIEPDFTNLKVSSRVLLKLKPPDIQDISLAKKTTEKYHLWHRAIVKSLNVGDQTCQVKLEHEVKSGEKRKSISDEFTIKIEEIFPLNGDDDASSDSSDSLSDTEYPDSKMTRVELDKNELLVEKSLLNNAPAMGEWERHTRGIGSKLMLAMGYVPGTGLGADADGRLQPVEARVLPVGKSLDHCMAITEQNADRDPLKVEQRLKRLQKKEEERNRKAYEREKEREKRNVFNFINNTLANKVEQEPSKTSNTDVKQSSSKDLNIEQFKITENIKKIEREIMKLNNSLSSYTPGTDFHRNLNMQILEKNKELKNFQRREQHIQNEQKQRKDKQKMTVF